MAIDGIERQSWCVVLNGIIAPYLRGIIEVLCDLGHGVCNKHFFPRPVLVKNLLKEILMNIVIRKSNELCQEEAKLKRLVTIKDALDTTRLSPNPKPSLILTLTRTES